MKIIKVILLLFLVLKSSGAFAISIPCCDNGSEPTETIISSDNDHDDDSDKKDCCGGSSCDCLCCSHVFTMQDAYELSVLPTRCTTAINAHYLNRLSRIYDNALWQPPRYS